MPSHHPCASLPRVCTEPHCPMLDSIPLLATVVPAPAMVSTHSVGAPGSLPPAASHELPPRLRRCLRLLERARETHDHVERAAPSPLLLCPCARALVLTAPYSQHRRHSLPFASHALTRRPATAPDDATLPSLLMHPDPHRFTSMPDLQAPSWSRGLLC